MVNVIETFQSGPNKFYTEWFAGKECPSNGEETESRCDQDLPHDQSIIFIYVSCNCKHQIQLVQ